VKEKEIFTNISSFVMGTIDPGQLVISGRVKDGIKLEEAEMEVGSIIQEVIHEGVNEAELEKVKNQAESTLEFGEVEVMNRAMNLAFSALSGNVNWVNTEKEKIEAVSMSDIKRVAKTILTEQNSSVLYYQAVN
jgi:zinc protease